MQIKIWLTLGGVLLATLFANLISPSDSAVFADNHQASWRDNATLEYRGDIYKETNIDDKGGWFFYRRNDPDRCQDEIKGLEYDPRSEGQSPNDTTVEYYEKVPQRGGCDTKNPKSLQLVNRDGIKTAFKWLNESAIQSVDGRRKFKRDGNLFLRTDDNRCKDSLKVGDNKTQAKLVVSVTRKRFETSDSQRDIDLRDTYNHYYFADSIHFDHEENDGDCIVSGEIEVNLGDVQNAVEPPGTNEEGTETGSGESGGEIECDAGPGLTWILCSIIKFVDTTVKWIQEEVVIPFLQVPPLVAETGDPAFDIWKSVRTIANILLVPVFFVIIFSQAASIGVDAYTIKKMLPRLLVAVVAIQFSFYIVSFLVDLANVFGNGLGDLIAAATTSSISFEFGSGGGILGLTVLGLGVGLAVNAAITGAIFLLIIPFVLAVLGVFFTLVFRQVLIIMLAILSPIAFASWVLPNTERLFKMWWDYLLKALMMYPLIVLLFAAGGIVAAVATGSNTSAVGQGTAGNVIALAAIIVPLALVPATFKFAGGALAMVGGAIQNLAQKGEQRAIGGKDGKGGIGTMVGRRKEERKLRAIGGGTALSKVPVIGGLARWKASPYFSSRGRRGAEVKAAAAIGQRAKEHGDGKYSNDQLKAMAYGSQTRMRQEADDLRRAGKVSAAEGLEDFLDAEHSRNGQVGKKSGTWSTIRGVTNPVDSAAAATALAEQGFAEEGMTKVAQERFKGDFGDRIAENIKGTSVGKGTKSAFAWGITDPAKRTGELQKAASRMSREDISTIKDWDEFAEPRKGGFSKIIADGRAAGATPESQAQAKALEDNMRQALHPQSGTSSQRQAQIKQWLADNNLNTTPMQPTTMPVNVTQVGGQNVPPGGGPTPGAPPPSPPGLWTPGQGPPPPPGTGLPSDIRLKNILEKVGEFSKDIYVYRFSYKADPAKEYIGLMAQELLKSKRYNQFVTTLNGYLAIHYDELGFKMKRIK